MPWPGWRRRRAPGCWPPATSATTTPTAAASPTCSPPSGSRTTVDALGYAAEANAERHLKPPAEMARLFADHPEALANSLAALEASARLLARPAALRVPGRGARARARRRRRPWPTGSPRPRPRAGRAARRPTSRERIAHELRLIERARLRALLPDRARHRPLRPATAASSARAAARPPTRRSATCSASPRSTRPSTTCCSSASSRPARRAARHRHRLRARAPRGGDPVPLRPLRPRAGGDLRHRHPLPRPQRRPRGRQGAGPLARTSRHGWPRAAGARATRWACRRWPRPRGSTPTDRRLGHGAGADRGDPRLPPPSATMSAASSSPAGR